jgi:hypothetical protein
VPSDEGASCGSDARAGSRGALDISAQEVTKVASNKEHVGRGLVSGHAESCKPGDVGGVAGEEDGLRAYGLQAVSERVRKRDDSSEVPCIGGGAGEGIMEARRGSSASLSAQDDQDGKCTRSYASYNDVKRALSCLWMHIHADVS